MLDGLTILKTMKPFALSLNLPQKPLIFPLFKTFFQYYRSRTTLSAVHVNQTHFSASEKSIQKNGKEQNEKERKKLVRNTNTRSRNHQLTHQLSKNKTKKPVHPHSVPPELLNSYYTRSSIPKGVRKPKKLLSCCKKRLMQEER